MGKFGTKLRVGFAGGSLESLWFGAPVSRAVEEEFGARGKVEKSVAREKSGAHAARRGQSRRLARYPERVREVVKRSGSLP